ncbi:substrate-binding domain-containing protein [Caldicellulosiruptor naganoensis]|uniref:Substrate-binding domain-containing protein n=1 Tax=Caldicellulosiruptor naganoensis TaxID=29324 RepID=A0ABY7BGC4_9FIRM|nr:substrate-binding domain-containing protein [Caldicellulosiruptor naganoensis]WAM31505.1 substrate-binding domain-containing protein [Caldicellulosiruptor naganoensis]
MYNASAMNYNVIVKYTFGDIEAENRAIDELMEADVKGLIINPVHGEYYNPKILKLVLDGFPVVLVDKFFKGINVPVISIDHKKAMKDLTRYLISCNHTNIAIISTKSQNTSSIEE